MPRHRLTAALVLLCFVGPLSTDMYLPAFPRMAAELRTDASGAQLTLTAFLAGMALGHLVLGPLSGRYGRRVPLLAGAAGCAAATALCALSPGLGALVALRLVAGFCGAAGVVVGRAVVADVATGPAAARLLGVLMTLAGLAPVVAPVAGGAVVMALAGATAARLVGRIRVERLLAAGVYGAGAAAVALLGVAGAGALTLASYLPLITVFCAGLGLALGNAAALAVARVPEAAGTGSALLGTAQSAVGAVVAPLAGLGGAEAAVPVFAGMAVCGGLAVLAARRAGGGRRRG
ncbi:MFS transporter [Streptomyces sp. NPDC093085]|uniref:MFS transporter n=1 Tax=Streptomyces sp. NPDC093085 TaxID=3155068 RepID=UPI00343EE489